MPKVSIDYSNTCFYKLVHTDDINDENIYIGHTTNMTKRKWGHKTACCNPNNPHYNLKLYQFIRENKGWEQWEMILVEKYSCSDVYEARARERYWIKQLKATLNTDEPGRTRNEWFEDNKKNLAEKAKIYYQQNKEHKRNYDKERYNDLKEKILENIKEEITCECGCKITKAHLTRHKRTQKHINLMNKKNLANN